MLVSMINLTAPRLIVKDSLKASGRVSASEIILLDFVFPGQLNRMSTMTKTPSSLHSISDVMLSNLTMQSRSGRFDELESLKLS